MVNRVNTEASAAKAILAIAGPTASGKTAAALAIAREKTPETPFLLVSGTIGEQAAIESLRSGATDYVLKQTPERLVPAVLRAVTEAQERARRRRAEIELIRREKTSAR